MCVGCDTVGFGVFFALPFARSALCNSFCFCLIACGKLRVGIVVGLMYSGWASGSCVVSSSCSCCNVCVSNIPMRSRTSFHLLTSVKAFVYMSAHILDDSSYTSFKSPCRKRSYSHATEIRCVLIRYLMVGFFPVCITRIIGWLSSWKYSVGLCGRRYFHSIIPGKPCVASALDNAIISASGVDRETHVCRCDNPAIGNDVCGTRRHKCAPDVDLLRKWVSCEVCISK